MLRKSCAVFGIFGILIIISVVPISHPMLDYGTSILLSRALRAKVSAQHVHLGLIHGFSAGPFQIRRAGKYTVQAQKVHAIPRLLLFPGQHRIQLNLNAQDLVVKQNWISNILSTERVDSVNFQSTDATIELFTDRLSLSKITAIGTECQVQAAGDMDFASNHIDLDITLSLAPSMVSDIPESLSRHLLSQDPSGFKTFTLKISGRRDLPSVEVASDRFRFTTKQARKL